MGVCVEERPVMHWQQSARYFSPHERSNTSPTAGNLTVLNSPTQCYPPSNDNLFHRPSCLTCPTTAAIGDHNDHPSALPVNPHFNSFHHQHHQQQHNNMHGPVPPQMVTPPNKNLIANSHATAFDSCETSFNHGNIIGRGRNDSLDENSSNFPNYFTDNVKKETITPPSSIKNNNIINNNNNNDTETSPSLLRLKTEHPDSPESSNATTIETTQQLTGIGSTPDECAGCGRLIQDRFYLSAVDKKWHSGCLQCCICENGLDGQASLFCREGNIYCKSDYYRIYSARRCSKCLASISSSELVMRARHLVFHLQCFSCAVCNQLLNKGDQFGIRSSAVYCRLHFEVPLDPSTPNPYSCSYAPSNPYCDSPNAPSSPGDLELTNLDNGYYGPHNGGNSNLPPAPRQKGRPRKRKPKDIEAMTSNLDLNSDYMDLGFGRGSMSGGSASSRTKRMRTSFKHHQLRTMKSYFAINHNPDAKDLKQLSQKTGLPKRVLQVWFQNARAKWRRMMMKQEGKSIDGEKGEGSIDLDTYETYNPNSPSYLVGQASPTSME